MYSPSVNRAFPPVGWQSTLAHAPHRTTVCAWEKTVVIAKQPGIASQSNGSHNEALRCSPGHFTSMKYELGDCTRRLSL